MYHPWGHPGAFLPEVQVEPTASTLYDADKPDLAAAYLTFHSATKAMHGIRRPQGDEINAGKEQAVNCLVGHDPGQQTN